MPRDKMACSKPKPPPTSFELFREDGMLFMPLHMTEEEKHEELAKRFEELLESRNDRNRLDKYFDKAEELFELHMYDCEDWEEMKAMKRDQAKKNKSMKSSPPMKALKTKKAMKRAKIVMRRNVYKGKTAKTTGGLPKGSLTTNKYGKVVSRTLSVMGKKSAWSNAIKQARKDLNLEGFVPAKKGSPLYKRAKILSKSS